MGLFSIDPRDRTPIYAQLEHGLRAAIATGRLRPGDQLPTVRQLAVELQVNLRWEAGTELFEYQCQQANYATELMVGSFDKVDRSTLTVP